MEILEPIQKYTSNKLLWAIVFMWSSFCLLETAAQDSCSDMPCRNGATCTNLQTGYNCTCVPGYTGELCDVDISDDCASRPCLNNGICQDGINTFTCACRFGFTGTLCESHDICRLNRPCPDNSTCVNEIGGNYTCVCPPDYTGEYCSIRIDDCASMPCMNGGTCTDIVDGFNCSCLTGFEGTQCDSDIDVCEESSCANGGTCIEGIGDAFHCECPPEFTSPDCSIALGICELLMPCQNNATCNDLTNGDYNCVCLPGFTLKNCTATTNNCLDSSCLNNGICLDQPCPQNTNCINSDTQNFSCICPEIFTGPDCGNITNCTCRNGGICSIGINDTVQCNCLLGWTGTLCEMEINIEIPAFNGNGYLQYSSLNQQDATITVINLAFRTAHPDGQLLYNGQDDVTGEGDFIQLRVTGGLLQLRVDLGSFITDVVSTERVDDNEWHYVEIRVDSIIATFTLDNRTTYAVNIRGTFTSLQLFGSLYLGGVDENIIVAPEAKNTPPFIGCIGQFEEDERNSFELAPIGGLNVINCNISACQDFVCENGGSCVVNSSSQLVPTCSCAEGFTGETCGTALCSTDPCLYGGTCVPIGEIGYRCICQLGYTGINCETALDISVPQFFNTSYIRYITDPSLTLRSTVIEIDVRPAQNFLTGILLYASQSSNIDYFLLALNAGRVVFQFNCGSGHGTVQSTDQLLAGVWHNIRVERMDNMATLTVNSTAPVTGSSRGTFSSLNLNNFLYVGGLPSGHLLPSSVNITTGFDGCIITNFTIAGMSGQNAVVERDSSAMVAECGVSPCLVNPCLNGGTCNSTGNSISCICPPPYLPPICNDSLPDPCISNNPCSNGSTCVSSLNGSSQCLCPFQRVGLLCDSTEMITVPSFRKTDYSHISFPTPLGLFTTSTITFTFLPYTSEGLVLYSAYYVSATTADFISLAMKDGYLEFRYNLGSGINPITSPTRLTLGQWYEVYASRVGRTGNLTVAGVGTAVRTSPGSSSHLDLTSSLYVGGAPDYRMLANDVGVSTGFNGCIYDLVINGARYEWANHLTSRNVEQCDTSPPVDPCLEQLGMECQNGGICVQSSVMNPNVTTYECRCTSDFTGVSCETSLACTLTSCRNGGQCIFDNQGRATVCSCPIPYAGVDCTDRVTIEEAMFNGQSYIEIRRNSITPSLPVMSSFSLEFRTNSSDGLIFWHGLDDSSEIDFISLGVVRERLELRFDLGIGAVLVSSNTIVSDGSWHTVTATRSNGTAILTLDSESPQDVMSSYTSLDTTSNFWIGGHENIAVTTYQSGLAGCVRQLYINNEAIDLDGLSIIASSSNVINCDSS